MNNVTAVVLIDSRRADVAQRALDFFVPQREVQAEEFEYPQYAETPEAIYANAEQVMSRLEASQLPYYLAWKDPRQVDAFVIYTEGADMIIGVATHPSESAKLLRKLQEVTGAGWGMIIGEDYPPDVAHDFMSACEEATGPRVLNGFFLSSG